MLELAAAVARAAGVPEREFAPQFQPGTARRGTAQLPRRRRARAELRLPDPTPLTTGLATTLDWVRGLRARVGT